MSHTNFCHCLHILFSIKKATIYFNRVGEDLVGYLGLRGLSIPISLEIDCAEVNNEREYLLLATCYLLTYYYACCCFPGLLYISLSYIRSSPSLPFSPPPSLFLFFLGGGRGGREVGGGGKGGGSKPPPPPLPPKGGWGGRSLPHPPTCTCVKK